MRVNAAASPAAAATARSGAARRAGNSPAPGDAWARMTDAVLEQDPAVAEGHGPAEQAVIHDLEEKVATPLRHAATSKLKCALLTTAVHVVRSGGVPLAGLTASRIRAATRAEVLMYAHGVHDRSDDDSQMLGIAIEHACQ
eukprot:jgi/Tetstr1/453998/TSEL_040917.t1